MSSNKEMNLREAAAEGARLVKDGKVNAAVAAILKPLVHQAKKALEFRDPFLWSSWERSGAGWGRGPCEQCASL